MRSSRLCTSERGGTPENSGALGHRGLWLAFAASQPACVPGLSLPAGGCALCCSAGAQATARRLPGRARRTTRRAMASCTGIFAAAAQVWGLGAHQPLKLG
jgi:hypothetical protein